MSKPPASGYILGARLLGVDVVLHWTFPLVGLFSGMIVRNLVLRSRDGLGLDVFAACAASTFALVALHELGHAAAFRLVGREVRGIIFSGAGGWCFGTAPRSCRANALVLAGGWIAQLAALLLAVVLLQCFGFPTSPAGRGVFVVFTGMNASMMLVSAFPHGTSDGAQLIALWSARRRDGR